MKSIFLWLSWFICSAAAAQNLYWKTNLNTGELGLLQVNFILQPQGNFYTGTTPPNAHKRIVGGIKAAFAKSMFQKDGSVAELDSIALNTDSITGFLLMQKRKYHLKGVKTGNQIVLSIYSKNSGKVYGALVAEQVPTLQKPKDYTAVWQHIKGETEKYIYRKSALETKQWKAFVDRMDEFSAIAEDDAEFAFGFFQYSKEIGFSHYAVMGSKEQSQNFHSANYKAPKTKVRPTLEPLDSQTMLLDIPAFNFRGSEIDSMMQILVQRQPKNLIIDVRNNTGGDMEGGMRICQYLTHKTLYGGIMLAQSYWNKNSTVPSVEQYTNFKPMNTANYEWFRNEVKNGVEGLCLLTQPLANTYKGKVVILTSGVTASAAEPFVYTLQKENIATIIGEKTSGSVLSMEYFFIGNLAYTIPMLDYYAFDGTRLDQKGVTPNIVCEQQQALTKALEWLQ
ncbi:MAG: hypothetical protein EAY68_04550 [Bacteroidetes bacterium]|nr:MAG: hypothetical protein EAY68_04550 [Bacteroidota bacterium]